MTKKLTMLSLAVAGLVAAAGSGANAAQITMSLSEINNPITGIAGVAGNTVVDLGGPGSGDPLIVTLDANPSVNFANAWLDITSGFAITSAVVTDSNTNGIADPGEAITGVIGAGAFDIRNAAGVLVHGTFSSAGFSSSVGSAAANILSSTVSNLQLTLGAAAGAFAGLPLGPEESLGLNIDGITPGVGFTANGVQPISGLVFGTINDFGPGQTPAPGGSITLRANVVPEPATLSLAGLGALGMIARRRRA